MYKSLGLFLLFVALAYADLSCIKHPEMTQGQMMEFLEELVDYPIPVNYSEPKTPNTFNCPPVPRSAIRPTSVHKLTPGDIDIVMALGDSLTAANGADASIITGVVNNYRGLSWSIGGEYYDSTGNPNNDVTQHFTLPNALKRYNPKIKGWASGIANFEEDSNDGHANLDMGIPGAKAVNLTYEAQELIKQLKNSDEYDFEKDWKMLTVFIGGNNLCQFCVDERSVPASYASDITAVLDLLHEQVPRMFVNLVTIFSIAQIAALGNNLYTCKKAHECFCWCGLDTSLKSNIRLTTYNGLYKDKLWDLILRERYETRDDFTVMLQPFFEETTVPQLEDGTFDLSYFAPDCFHFSVKGHNAAGKALWNSLFEPFAQKSRMWDLGDKLILLILLPQ
jgi:phospholipase B1